MNRYLALIFLCVLLLNQNISAQDKVRVVVTSSWTAAYAQLAGIDDYEMLAPSDMQHPSEYEIQIEDIRKLKNADLIICGGYETMMEKIRTGLQIEPEKILQIQTDYNLKHINNSVRTIANKVKTSEQAEKNLSRLNNLFEESKARIKESGISEVPVISQFFMKALSDELELKVSGIFGPRQLEAFDIQDMMKLDFELILDNAHNPSAQPLVETRKDARIAYLINFPGKGSTESLEDVVRYNVDMIIEAYTAGK